MCLDPTMISSKLKVAELIAWRPSVKFRRVRAVQFSDHVLHVAMQSDSRIEQHCYGSPSTTKSSQRATNVDWKKRMPLELQQMQEEASSHSTDLLAMLQPLTPWFVRATASSSERQCRAQNQVDSTSCAPRIRQLRDFNPGPVASP